MRMSWPTVYCIVVINGRDSIASSSWRAEWQHRGAGRARAPAANSSTPVLSPSAMRVLPISVAQGDRLSLKQTDRELRGVAVVAAGGSRWRLKGTVSSPQSPARWWPNLTHRWHMNEDAASRVCPVGKRWQFMWKQSIELLFNTSCYLYCK